MNETRSARRRLAAAITVALTVGGLVAAVPTAHAVEEVETSRVAGTNRYETAAAVSETAYPDGADSVVLASGEAFPDALAGSALAGHLDAPTLLTTRDQLSPAAADAIEELGADSVSVLGGTAAVSEAVVDTLEDDGLEVTRIAGSDRFGTAAAIAAAIGADNIGELGDLRTAFIATGLNFADALAGGPLAAAGSEDDTVNPILLVSSSVPTATSDAIDDLGIEQVVILGGTAAVSAAVEDELEDQTGNPPIRVAGSDRFATAAEVGETALDDFAFETATALLANGLNFPDALAGGPFGGTLGAPVLLIPSPDQLGAASAAFLDDHSPLIETIVALGGTAVVSDAVLAEAQKQAETIDNDVESAEEAPAGAFDVTVRAVDKDNNFFVGCEDDGDTACARYDYDTGDSYSIGGAPQVQNGMANFEAAVSPSDTVSGTYEPEPAGESSFSLTDAAPVAPETATAAANEAGTADITFAESNTATTDEYRVYRAPATAAPNGTVAGCPDFNTSASRSSYSVVGTVPDPSPEEDENETLTFTDISAQGITSYCYAVTAMDDGDESNTGRAAAGPGPGGSVTTTADRTAPQSTDATVPADGSTPDVADKDDRWRITFSEPVEVTTAATSPSTISVRDDPVPGIDPTADTATVKCVGGDSPTDNTKLEATCRVNTGRVRIGSTVYDPGMVLSVRLLEPVPPSDQSSALHYPLTITAATAVTDAAGNQWTPADDPDKVLENRGDTSGENEQTVGGDLDADVDAEGPGDDFVTVRFTEPINEDTFHCVGPGHNESEADARREAGTPEGQPRPPSDADVTLTRRPAVPDPLDPEAETTIPCFERFFNADSTVATVTFGDTIMTGDVIEMEVDSVTAAGNPGDAGPGQTSRTRTDTRGPV